MKVKKGGSLRGSFKRNRTSIPNIVHTTFDLRFQTIVVNQC